MKINIHTAYATPRYRYLIHEVVGTCETECSMVGARCETAKLTLPARNVSGKR